MLHQDYQRKLHAVGVFVEANMPNLPYHNFGHACNVDDAFTFIGIQENILYEKLFLGKTIAKSHDAYVDINRRDNEEKTVELMIPVFEGLRYSPKQIVEISRGIMATKMPTKPTDELEYGICDSDIWNIGGDEFWISTDLVRREYGQTDLRKWYTQVAGFLANQRFYTETGKKLRTPGLEKNRRLVDKLLQDFEKERGMSQIEILDTHLDRYGLRAA